MSSEALTQWLRDSGTSQIGLSARISASRGSISRWASGERRPSVAYATRIEDVTGGAVPATSWGRGVETRGARVLTAWMAREGLTAGDAAVRLGISRNTFRGLLTIRRMPQGTTLGLIHFWGPDELANLKRGDFVDE